jgi:hypothetical protein
MIRNEKDYKTAVRRVENDKKIMAKQIAELKKQGLSDDEIERAMHPVISFNLQFVEDVEWYERAKRGDFNTIDVPEQIGRLLIALRIASGLSQKDFAKCRHVTEAQVSRDERNEYHGITVERAEQIMKIYGAHLKAKVDLDRELERETIMAACVA